MARPGRPGGLSAAGKKELWQRWKAGESISDIARALQKPPGSIHGIIETVYDHVYTSYAGAGCSVYHREG